MIAFVEARSQTSFRGGNGPVAVGNDSQNRVLVATPVANELDGGDANAPINAMAVARFSPNDPSGTLEWTPRKRDRGEDWSSVVGPYCVVGRDVSSDARALIVD